MRDQDEDTAPLRFLASRGDRKPLGQQMRDSEDRYWNTARDLRGNYEPTGWHCPYCGNECPPGCEPSTWACCGEAGHAVKDEDDE